MNQIVLVQEQPPQIIVQGDMIMGQVIPFSFVCTTQGQTVFGPLPVAPSTIIALGISGVLQNGAVGDYTFSGLYITTAQGLNLGDTLYGTMQTYS